MMVRSDRRGLAKLNYLGACVAGVLTALGLLASAFGGLLVSVPASLLTAVAWPLAGGFLLAGVWWQRRWPHAPLIQLLPFLWILGWAALILLSPVQPQSSVR